MKNLIYVLVFVLLGFCAFTFINSKKEAQNKTKLEDDYQKIEAVHQALEKVCYNKVILEAPGQDHWTVFDLRIAFQQNNKFYNALKTELGADFDTKLSTGDYIFVGIWPMNQKYKIYAIPANGTVDDKVDMLYPEWTYKKLEKK